MIKRRIFFHKSSSIGRWYYLLISYCEFAAKPKNPISVYFVSHRH